MKFIKKIMAVIYQPKECKNCGEIFTPTCQNQNYCFKCLGE